MASDFTKPDKVHTLFPNEIQSKMWKLDVSELFMIGRKSVPRLNNMGIKTIGDLARYDEKVLLRKFGKFGKIMHEYANGIDDSEVIYKKGKSKSVGNSITLPVDVSNKEKLEMVLLSLVEQVAFRLRKEALLANVVSVQLRTKEFFDFSHQGKLEFATSDTKEIYAKAKKIFDEMYKPETPIRLIGCRVDNLIEADYQISMFNDNKQKGKLDKTIDSLKEKYGYSSVTRARRD